MSEILKAAMVVILDQKKRVLILKRSSDPGWMPEKWALVGGHIEKEESPKDTAIRETKEETNLNLSNINELEKRGQVMIYYSNSYSGTVKIDFEHTDWAWASYDELDNYDTTPGLKDTVELAMEKLK
jgi:8-oxo-dGTP diphosphatase|tara:strand:+ start:846 stop:1226 length:381 start_codon:yes stop_codon:yes gene_type:complete